MTCSFTNPCELYLGLLADRDELQLHIERLVTAIEAALDSIDLDDEAGGRLVLKHALDLANKWAQT